MTEFQKGEMTNSNGWTLEWGSAYIQVRDENGDYLGLPPFQQPRRPELRLRDVGKRVTTIAGP